MHRGRKTREKIQRGCKVFIRKKVKRVGRS